MFTGIIEEVGKITQIESGSLSSKLTIEANTVLEQTKLGDSIATNGVCLTVTNISENRFTVDVMAETLRFSSLNNIAVGDHVNLERALSLKSRLGGHIVSGHIDGVGTISQIEVEDNATWITVTADSEILKYIVAKGSVALDGISLTVARIEPGQFKVSIIPHTGSETTLLSKPIGSSLNIECDIIGKYVERFVNPTSESQSNIDLSFLANNGFI